MKSDEQGRYSFLVAWLRQWEPYAAEDTVITLEREADEHEQDQPERASLLRLVAADLRDGYQEDGGE